MALVERYVVVAALKAVASGETIKEGQIVSLNASGEVVLQSSTNKFPYGLAGDTKSTSASAMPGIYDGWQNRVSDYFDETKASGKMTVYHSGGEFATDQWQTNVASADPMAVLYGYQGKFDTHDGHSSSVIVARLTRVDGYYPSGVPGTDLNGDMALKGDNTNAYIEVKLVI